jgi:hypothetical protein
MTAKRRFKFNSSYKEEVELGDGQEVTLRLVQPTDKKLLLSGLARMSPQSRYFRFMGARNGFKESELRYLCEVDGINHFATSSVCPMSQRWRTQQLLSLTTTRAKASAGCCSND